MDKTARTPSTILKFGIYIYIPSCYIKWTGLLGHPVPIQNVVSIFISRVPIPNRQDFWDTQYQSKVCCLEQIFRISILENSMSLILDGNSEI